MFENLSVWLFVTLSTASFKRKQTNATLWKLVNGAMRINDHYYLWLATSSHHQTGFPNLKEFAFLLLNQECASFTSWVTSLTSQRHRAWLSRSTSVSHWFFYKKEKCAINSCFTSFYQNVPNIAIPSAKKCYIIWTVFLSPTFLSFEDFKFRPS